MSTATSARTTPPLRRDHGLQAWIVVRAISDGGDAAWTIALAWTAVHLADPGTAGAVVAGGTMPRAVVLLLGGAVADRHDPRRLVLIANGARVVVLVAVVATALLHAVSVPLLLAAAILFGVTDAVHQPAAGALTRQVVHPGDLAEYAGLSQTVSRLGAMGGAVLGGVVVASSGLVGSAVANAVSFVLLLVVLSLLLPARYEVPRSDVEQSVLRQVRGGLHHLRTTPSTRRLVLSLSGLNLAVTPALSLGIVLRSQEAGWGATTVGLLEATVGLGAAAGAAAMAVRRPCDLGRWGFGALVVQGAAIPALGLGPLVLTAVAAGVIGLSAGVASALLSALYLRTVDTRFLGRTSSIQALGDDVGMPVAMVAFGALAAATSALGALTAFGVSMGLLMLWTLVRMDTTSSHDGGPATHEG